MDYIMNSTIASSGGDYNISIVASWFNKIPHIDIRFNLVNNTFDPNDNEYLESVGILVAVPGFWLIITLLFFLIFFLCRCCDVNSKKGEKLSCCKCCLFLFTIISSAFISVGIYGHIQSHNGLVQVQNSTNDLAQIVNTSKVDCKSIKETLENRVDSYIDQLVHKLIIPLVKNTTVLDWLHDDLLKIRKNITKATNKIDELTEKTDKINIEFIPKTLAQFEQIRWPTTFAILGSLAFICFILLCGILRHSRCLLILFSVLGLLSLVICWVLASVYLGLCVAGSDFCMDPQPFFNKQFNGILESSVANYYLHCDEKQGNPFRRPLRETRKSIENMEVNINEITKICEDFCPGHEVKDILRDLSARVNEITSNLNSLARLSECRQVHNDYISTMSSTCKNVLEGVSLMLVSTAATGLCFTLLVLCASHTWINIRKKKPSQAETAEESDPFLPPASSTSTASSANSKRMRDNYSGGPSGRPRFSHHTPPQTPHFPGPAPTSNQSINGRSVNREDQLAFLSPPPSYEQVGHGHHHGHHHGHQAIGPHYVVSSRRDNF